MEERNIGITIFKASNPEELIVFKAVSLQEEIRFYLNNTQYITAIEDGDGNISVEVGEEVERKEENKKSSITIIKENFKEILTIFFLSMFVFAASILVIIYLIDNPLISLIVVDVSVFICSTLIVVVLEAKNTSPELKSKHSAEHMMANFLENNKRLPKNMKEVKKASRFSIDCGSRKMIEGIAEDFILRILAAILAFVANALYLVFWENMIGVAIVFIGVYCITSILVGRLLKKHGKLKFVINPIKRVLTNIAQCANTTKKVKDKDIILAYCAARMWMQLVYPEFYKLDDDVFMNNY